MTKSFRYCGNHHMLFFNYQHVVNNSNGIKLWNIIEVHRTSDYYLGIESQQLEVKQQFYQVFQRNNQEVESYYEYFSEAVRSFKEVNLPTPSDQEQAIRFLQGLNREVYQQLHDDMHNYPQNHIENKKSLHNAYMFAVNFRNSKSHRSINQKNVFFSDHKHPNNNKKNKNNNKQEKKQEEKTDIKPSNEEQKSNSKVYCKYHKTNSHSTEECKYLNSKKSVALVETSQCTEYVNENITHVLSTDIIKTSYDDENLILLDSCAQTSIFSNKSLLTNMTELDYPMTISGISKSSTNVKCFEKGKLYGLQNIDINYSHNSKKNILCLADILKFYRTTWNEETNTFIIFNDFGEEIEFHVNHNILCTTFNNIIPQQINFTQKEIERATLAREISKRLGYESDGGLSLAIKQNSILNLPVTIKDISNAQKIFGPEVPAIKGKSTVSRSKIIPENYIGKYEDKYIQLFIDIMFVNKNPYLITISDPINLTMVDELKGYNIKQPRSSEVVNKILSDIISKYRSESFFIYEIVCDNDKSFLSLSTVANNYNCKISYVSVKSNQIAKIDRKIRFIKDRARSILCGLHFQIPSYLYKYLIYFVVQRINLINHSYNNLSSTSPIEAFTGIKSDFNRDLKSSFGEYCQVLVPETDNSMDERTNGCIALSPSSDKDGSILFFHLNTKKIIKRNKWISLAITDNVIQYMNELSVNNKENFDIIYPNEFDENNNESNEINNEFKLISPAEEYQVVNSLPHPELNQFNQIQTINSQLDTSGRKIVKNFNFYDPDDDIDLINDYIDESTDCEDPNTESYLQSINSNQNNNLSVINHNPNQNPNQNPNPNNNPNINDEVESFNNETIIIDDNLTNYGEDITNSTSLSTSSLSNPPSQTSSKYGREYHPNPKYADVYNLTIEEALQQDEPNVSIAINKELQQMLTKGVWHPVNNENNNYKTITCKLFLKKKNDTSGTKIWKARLVAGGHLQIKENTNTYSPTAHFQTIFCFVLNAAKHDHHVVTVDITGAYLNANMTNDVYVNINKRI